MSFNDKQIELLQNLYNDASLGLTTGQKLYSYLKSNGETGYTLSKINEFLKSLEVNQVLTKRRGNIFFVAEGPLEQFQIDLVYMNKSWFNNGFKYIFCCIDVFSKKADMIPLKDREQASRSGLVSEAGTDEEIVYLISAASPARWLGPGARHRTGRCYSSLSRDSPGASAARQGPSGFDDSGQLLQSVATQLGQLVAYSGWE